MNPGRRAFLKQTAVAGAIAANSTRGGPAGYAAAFPIAMSRHPDTVTTSACRPTRSGIPGPSRWDFETASTGPPRWASTAVEILHVQMQDESNAALQKSSARPTRSAWPDGLFHASGVRQPRRRPAEHQRPEDALPDRPGLPTGHPHHADQHRPMGDVPSFDDFMAKKGIEPALEGHTEEEAFGWVIGSIEKLLPRAEECGVVLGLENHWGLGRTAAGVLRIVEAIRSPWLRMTLDTGNFLERPYEQMAGDGVEQGADRPGAGQDLLRRRPVVRAGPRLWPDRRICCGSMATGDGSPSSLRATMTPRPPSRKPGNLLRKHFS